MNLLSHFRAYAEAQAFKDEPQSLYEPINYLLGLGGKAMRPVLVLMAYRLFGGEEGLEKALPAAYAVELFHNFSLMHDDIMDKADLRRGQATVHQKYDANTAILSGDVMLVKAYESLAKVPQDKLLSVLTCFNRTCVGVCEGQRLDMDFETQAAEAVSMAAYLKMIELKTAVLLAGGMHMGAILGGATEDEAALAAEFGRLVGVAFQLQDDYLDTFGQDTQVGKRIGGDIVQNKKTYLVIEALNTANEEDREALLKWLTEPCEGEAAEKKKIKAVTAIFKRSGAEAKLRQAVKDYGQAALEALQQVPAAEKYKRELAALLAQLETREA